MTILSMDVLCFSIFVPERRKVGPTQRVRHRGRKGPVLNKMGLQILHTKHRIGVAERWYGHDSPGNQSSTKDVDFMVPNIGEYNYLTKQLPAMGYTHFTSSGWRRKGDTFHFDIFGGNYIHTTELLGSPLAAGQNGLLVEFSRLYTGILNDYDLVSSKLMCGTKVVFEDCVMLAEAHKDTLDLERLSPHFS